jgi:hypothetical protein
VVVLGRERHSYYICIIEDYLSFGFISSGEKQPRPKFFVCDDKLANPAMFPRKVKGHLHTKHSHLSEKTVGCFGRLIDDQTRQARQWTKITATSDKTQEASHAVAEIVAKD